MNRILLFVALFMAYGSYSQTADYLENSPRWLQRKISNNDPCWVYNNFIYSVNGDSVVGAYTYKKLYKNGEINWVPMSMGTVCSPTQTYNSFKILIRQEGKKMYVHDGMQDTLLYDFDLGVGDTLPITYNNWENDVVIANLDSMLIDGVYRRMFYWDDNPMLGANFIIEGVGSDEGLLEQLGLGFSGYELLCHEYNGDNYLVVGASCNFNVGVNEIEKLSPSIKVHPIPADEEVTITFSSAQLIEKVVAIDALGRSLELNFNSINGNEMQVDVAELNDGIYFLILSNTDGQSINSKIVIH